MATLYSEFMLKPNCFFLRIGLLFTLIFLVANVITAQNTNVTISGVVKDSSLKSAIAFVNVVLKTEKDTAFIMSIYAIEHKARKLFYRSNLHWLCFKIANALCRKSIRVFRSWYN